MAEKMFNVGKIVNTHGIRGEVKVKRITDFEERFEIGAVLYVVQKNNHIQELKVASHRVHKGFDLLSFEGFNNIIDVEPFKGAYLKITEDQLTELPEGEFYYHDIIGCEVKTIEGEVLGKIKEILAPGANDVWVVKGQKEKDILIPYIKDVVKQVDITKKEVLIDPIEGLLD